MNNEGKIEELKKKLYSNTDHVPKMKHVKLHEHNVSVDRGWEERDLKEEDEELEEKPKSGYTLDKFYPFLKGLVVFSVIFLIVALGIAYYYFNVSPNVISNANINITVSGPVVVSAGEVLSLDVDIFNNNPAALEIADLIISYPEGTRRADDRVTSLVTERIPIGDIAANGTQRTTIKVILLGEEGSSKDINVSLEYKMPGSNSIFSKGKTYPIGISTGPVSINVDSIKEITPEQESKFVVSVKSNSSDVIRDVVLRADYPFGFDYIKASPSPSASNNSWRLGDIAPGETKKLEVNARIFGQANQERTVRFYAGTGSAKDPNEIDALFASVSHTINLQSPFLGADIAINGSGNEIIVVKSGQLIQADILWKNNLDVSIHNVSIEAKIAGIDVDRKSIVADGGFYKSIEDVIYWEESNSPELEEVAPNQHGTSKFNMKVFELTKDLASNLRRPEITLNFTVKGNRVNENNVPEEVASQASRKIRVSSDLELNTVLLYNDGPFVNTGAIPPKVEKETTYTANVKVYNSYNNIRGAIYTAKLPIYVKWLGKVSPMTASSTVVYNSENRTITWNAGDIAPGTGYISNPKEMSFQVGFTPSLSQENQSPVIVDNQRIAGTDSFTNAVLSANGYSLTTQIKFDSKYDMGLDKVVGR